jgi:hypothetical protein
LYCICTAPDYDAIKCPPPTKELTVSPEVVLTLMAQLEGALAEWFRHQAPETLKGRLTREEFMVRLTVERGKGETL